MDESMKRALALDEATKVDTADADAVALVFQAYDTAVEVLLKAIREVQVKGGDDGAMRKMVRLTMDRMEDVKKILNAKREEEQKRAEEEDQRRQRDEIRRLSTEVERLQKENDDFHVDVGHGSNESDSLWRQLSHNSQEVYSNLVEDQNANPSSSSSCNEEESRRVSILNALHAVRVAYEEHRISKEEKKKLKEQMLNGNDRTSSQGSSIDDAMVAFGGYDEIILRKLTRGQERCLRQEICTRQNRNQRQYQGQAPPGDYECPITHALMDDPVVAADGHSYERSAIEGTLINESMSRCAYIQSTYLFRFLFFIKQIKTCIFITYVCTCIL